MSPRCDLLRELATALESGKDLSQWSGGSLVAVYATPGALLPRTDRQAVWVGWIRSTASVQMFLPLMVTWSGLGFAVWAYGQQRSRTTGQLNGTFLELWQQGFGGQLPTLLRFDFFVAYTVGLLLALVGLTLWRQRWEERTEREDQELLRRLADVLARTEARATALAHTEPVTFVQQLQGAAAELRSLLAQSSDAQGRAVALLHQATAATGELARAADGLMGAVTTVEERARQLTDATTRAAVAAEGVQRETTRLRESIQEESAGFTRSVAEAVALATAGLEATAGRMADGTREVLEASARASEEQLSLQKIELQSAAERHAEELTARAQAAEQDEQVRRAALTSAVAGVAAAAVALSRQVEAFPAELATAAQAGAEHIGNAYELAVVALSASLHAEVRDSSLTLAERVDELDALLTRHAATLGQGRAPGPEQPDGPSPEDGREPW
ncbi:hypothetical protein ACIRBX_01090 [Kitasatospora sp. NPDC096147]|uniref:hypothetical protein n=1 Tax=Kitasatospora sp. NPDC096147 TaxID=3364093 RepID=UPI0038121F2E